MDISIIIPTFNNYKRLEITLEAFTRIHIPSCVSWELIVINNNSNDQTRDTLLKYSHLLPLKFFDEYRQGISFAKNLGLANSRGRLIIFADDDVKPCNDWLDIYWNQYLENETDYFWGGPVTSEFESTPKNMDLIKLAPPSVKGLSWGNKMRVLEKGEYFIGANWAVPSIILKKTGGFDTELGLNSSPNKVMIGEENDLMNRLVKEGLRPLYLPNASITHFVPQSKTTLEHIAARSEASGRFMAHQALNSHGARVFGIPRWIYGAIAKHLVNALVKRLALKNWYFDYICFRRYIGCVKQIKKY